MAMGVTAGVGASLKTERAAKKPAVESKPEKSPGAEGERLCRTTRQERQDQQFFGQMKALSTMGGLWNSAKSVVDTLKSKLQESREGGAEADRTKGQELSRMPPGSKKTLAVKGGGHVRGYGGEQEFQFEIERREDGKFVVSRNLSSAALAKRGDAKASLGLKMKDDYVFESPEEAARAYRILEEQTRKDMRAELRAELPGEAESRRRDQEFLDKNRSTLSLTGAGAAEYARKLGLPVKGEDKLNLGQLAGRGQAEVEVKVNYEKDPEGGPARASSLEINVSTGLEVDGELQPGSSKDRNLTPSDDILKDMYLKDVVGKYPGAKTNARLTVSTTLPLPAGLDGQKLLEDPGTLGQDLQAKTKIVVQHSYDLGGKSGRVTTAEFEPGSDPQKNTEAVSDLIAGRPDGLRLEPGKVTVTTRTYEKQGTQYSGEIDVFVAGYEMSYEDSQTTYSPEKRVTF